MDFFNDDFNGNDNDNGNGNGNFRYNQPTVRFGGGVSETEFKKFKSKLTRIVVIVLVLLVAANVVFWAVMRGALTDNITADIISESGESIINEVKASLTDEVLEQYERQYSLPAEGGVGLQTAAASYDSVVVINCSYSSGGFRGTTAKGSASGLILTSSGYVLTNAHVVFYDTSTKTKYTTIECVVSTSGTDHTYTLKVEAYDIDKDLALCKITGTLQDTLKPVTFSTLYNVGEEVAVIGNAASYGISVTTGVLSQLPHDYTAYGFDITSELIQTDAAVNPGNSGGGLFNIYGQCLGVVCAKIAAEDVEGIGYAISSECAVDFVKSANSSIQLSSAQ